MLLLQPYLILIAISILSRASSFLLYQSRASASKLCQSSGPAVESSSSVSSATPGQYKSAYVEINVDTLKGISFHDITPQLRKAVRDAGVKCGSVSVLTRHTTTAITINEMEGRLIDDARQYLLKLTPPLYPYLHNDIHLRSG
jgi:hypothetical protein